MNKIIAIFNKNVNPKIARVIDDLMKDSTGKIDLTTLERKFNQTLGNNPITEIPESMVQDNYDLAHLMHVLQSPLYHILDGHFSPERYLKKAIPVNPTEVYSYEPETKKADYIN